MKKLKFVWVQKKGQYQTGESLYLNKIRVADYEWNSWRSKTEAGQSNTRNYIGTILLPSLSDSVKHVYGESPDEIKPKIESVVTNWFKEATRE